ncbi:gamma-tubulin complex component 5-like [Styela clava]
MISDLKLSKKVTNATARLVKSLTCYEEGGRNHDACKAFALSRFQHHSFLDVNECKVERWIDGMCEKFLINSQPRKAELLKNLKVSFSESNICESSGTGSRIHYCLLSILLNLSENPVNTDYVQLNSPQKQDCGLFDWPKYLLQGEELPYPTQWAWDDTPPTSEDEELILHDVLHRNDTTLNTSITLKSKENKIKNINKLQVCCELVPEYWKANKTSIHCDLESFRKLSESDIKEVYILREVLWLLSGEQNLHVFPFVNGKHVPNAEIKTNHATPTSYLTALLKIARYGDIVRNIINFTFTTSQQECQTYQAFSESLLNFMKSFRADLMSLQRRIFLHEETLLLGNVIKILSPRLHELSVIHDVLQNSVSLDKPSDSNAKKSSRLLGTLYNSILDQSDCLTKSLKQSQLWNVLIQLWADALCPYFDMMDEWMSHGSLIDPYYEFIVQRSPICHDVKSEAFWNDAFILASEDCMKHLSWLRSVLHNVIVAGKSMEVLLALGKVEKNESKLSFHDAFIHSMSTSVNTITKNPQKENLFEGKSACDSMLLLNFKRLFEDSDMPDVGFNATATNVDKQIHVPTIIQSSLHNLVKVKSQTADQALLQMFLNQYKLIFNIECFHKFYLMEWGDVIFDFTSTIFRKMSSGEYWEDIMSLRASLQEAISDRDPEAALPFITVTLNRSKHTTNNAHNLIQATDIIELYFDINWPLNVIFTDWVRESYNSIFGYLMQMKHCLFCLQNLKFNTIQPKSKSETGFSLVYAHRLALLRSKILRLILHWHNFVMTSVIQAEKEVFFTHIGAADNIDDIIKAHHKFLDRVMTLCLLHEKKQADKMIQGTLRKIFNLAVILHLKWNRGLESISIESLNKYESEYKECSDFLGIILQNLVSRGAVPLSLESLAFFLLS